MSRNIVIRDAVHGNIEVSPLEQKILDSQEMQRLRFVRQLSTAYLVFPSAVHTRFEHSLGAMHLSGALARQLELKKEQASLLRLAGLLHDVGHGAFAHDTDEILEGLTGRAHEERGMQIVKEGEIGREIEKYGFSLKELLSTMRGEGAGALLTSDMGTDRMDYLLRDAYFTGVSYSLIDAERLLHSLDFRGGQVLVSEKGKLAAESLLVSRHFMFNAVYYHPTIRISKQMLKKSVTSALERGEISVQDVSQGTDYSLLEKLAKKSALAKKILERRLYKKAFVLDAAQDKKVEKFFAGKNAQKDFEEEIISSSGLDENEFVVCAPERGKKRFSVKMLREDGGRYDLSESSPIVRALSQEASASQLLIVACEEKHKGKVERAARKVFG